jgi:hypothetical protein
MNRKRRLISLKLLMKAIHRMKKNPRPGKAAAKIDSKSSSLSASAAAAVEDGKGGEVFDEARSKAARSTNNPKGAVLRSRLHGQRGGLNKKGKGVVRVKVVLTKEEAARLLSLTVGGQKHTAAQIVAEMRKMEARRAAANAAWRPALASIPEESS